MRIPFFIPMAKERQMLTIQASVSKGYLHQEGGFSFGENYYFDPLWRRTQDLQIAEFLDQRFSRYRIHNLESNLVSLPHYNEQQIYVGGIQPNLILGMLAGAEFIAFPDQDPDISPKPLEGLSSIEDIPPAAEFLDKPLIRNWLKEFRSLDKEEPGRVIPPFFWDRGGRATIHGSFTTALKFFGQEIMFTMYDDPGLLTGFNRWYEEVSVGLIKLFAEEWDVPVTGIHIGECSGTMVSISDYRSFIAPVLQSLSEKVGPVRLHHCGDCTYLLPEIACLPGVTSLDTGSGTSVVSARSQLGPDFPLDLMPPVELLLHGREPEDVGRWLNQSLEENCGGPLTINYHLEPGYDQNNHLLIHEMLYDKGIVSVGRR